MYTQEIICPHCGKMTIVNVADGKATTTTPCKHFLCKKSIIIETDKEGKVVSIQKDGCFLTTASTQYAGLSDNCDELQILRKFRDEYVSQLPNGLAIITQYYNESPKIVEALSQSSTSAIEYKEIVENISSIITLIHEGNNLEALSAYSYLFFRLSNKYLTNNDTLKQQSLLHTQN
jgi:hypothetical protein